MKSKYTFLFCFFCTFISLKAQVSKDYAVQLQTQLSISPASITLKWLPNDSASQYKIYRKSKNTFEWGTPIATLPGTATEYTDASVVAAKGYEYYVRRAYPAGLSFAHGYIYAGINLPVTETRGKLLLLVDENYEQPLAKEITQLQLDLITDGWMVETKTVSRTAAVTQVKALIKSEYDNPADTGINKLKALYLLGRIPVPYSGLINPDGHPDHLGAWPADMYYGVMDASFWTDNSVDNMVASLVRNQNAIGDGKFDPNYVFNNGSDVKLQIGRVDLTNMPSFGMSDTLLVKQYLTKAHQFKTGQMPVVRRGVIDDNFGAMAGEAFASSGWRNFSTMFGDSIFEQDYFTSIKSGNYLFSYGCGGGWFQGASGIGTTADFNDNNVNTVFTMLFGSYFGDWDSEDNFLRAPLCSPKTGLASAWSGRPYWYFHHMSLGENIGFSAQLTQSNYSDFTGSNHFGYAFNYAPTFVHIALMGDPSLRLHPVEQAHNLNLTTTNSNQHVVIKWNKVSDVAVTGYTIYDARTLNAPFKLVTTVSASDSIYTHTNPFNGNNVYMVRPIKLEQTPSGTYYNMALGVLDSINALNTGVDEESKSTLNISLYPNPSKGIVHIYMEGQTNGDNAIECYDFAGRMVIKTNMLTNNADLDFTALSKGLYIIKVKSATGEVVKKVIIE
jgi:hypothetical protein